MTDDRVNVLIVDDYPGNLLVLESILEPMGLNLVRASSGREALRAVLNQEFAVILLDVQMPEMDGFETAQLIHERELSRHTPIIFITAIGVGEEFVSKGYASGALDYIIKPIAPYLVTSKVKVCVDLFRAQKQTRVAPAGMVIGFLGAKGGVGTTTTVINVATAITQGKRDVIVAEFTSGYGALRYYATRHEARDAESLLDLEPKDIDERALNECLTTTPYGTRLLLGSDNLEQTRTFSAEQASATTKCLARMTQTVVLDISHLPADVNRSVVESCNAVALVVTPDMVCADMAVKTLYRLKLYGAFDDSVGVVVVNRAQTPTMSLSELSELMDARILAVVQHAADFQERAVKTGIPFVVDQPRHIATESYTNISNQLLADHFTYLAR